MDWASQDLPRASKWQSLTILCRLAIPDFCYGILDECGLRPLRYGMHCSASQRLAAHQSGQAARPNLIRPESGELYVTL